MLRWLVARLGRAAIAAWGIASLVFIISRLLPGGPEQVALAEAGDLSHPAAWGITEGSRQAARQAMRHRLGLDEPLFYITRSPGPTGRWHWQGLHNQYHRWVSQLVRGNLGQSYRDGQPVTAILGRALTYTLPLAASAAVLALALALGLGLYLARTPGGRLSGLLRTTLAAVQITPVFLIALALLLLLANPDVLNILPAARPADDGGLPGTLAALSFWLGRSVLPLFSLVLAILPTLTLPLAAALREELGTPYATTAHAKGLTTGQVLVRHALPNALLPLLTILTDLLPALVAGTVVVEVVFALPGSGRLLAEAAAAHDYPVVVAGVLFAAAARLVGLVLADGLSFWIDPRLRFLA